ncbi:MAG: hypothetical protein OEV64_02335 [Desulfobulbaceae bacterium]|nr:hypothetical protein [Desulfobulbaceae bacterium]
MSPEITTAATVVATILQALKDWKLTSLIALELFAPWIVLLLVSFYNHRRFEAVVKMYENNYLQVEQIKTMANGFKEMADQYRETLIYSIQQVTEAKEVAENNLHCPLVRKNSNPKDIG